jgi:hypothetical protein
LLPAVVIVVVVTDADEEEGSVETDTELEEDAEDALKVDVDEVAGEEEARELVVEEVVSIKWRWVLLRCALLSAVEGALVVVMMSAFEVLVVVALECVDIAEEDEGRGEAGGVVL